MPSSLIDEPDVRLVGGRQEPAQLEEGQEVETVAEVQAQAAEVVEMTFGYPNSLLLENDIEPQMLHELPEELRAEILSTIQTQFEEW